MMAQSYNDYPEDESLSELPVVNWRLPVYINGDLSDLVVPRPTSYPYNFDHITAPREELLNKMFEQHMFINKSKRIMHGHTRKYCLRGISFSSGFTTGGTPTWHSSTQFQEEQTLHGTFLQHEGVAATPQPSGTIMYNLEECYQPVQRTEDPYASVYQENMDIGLGSQVEDSMGMDLNIGLSMDGSFDSVMDTPPDT
ncbi:hypothetical protein MKW98_001041 [Papaver atlanticum]|uniref:Uncharacterized protein n=1 Tax=Papaver atlanticum TaxID=357466 RepID=A0AAD4S058_9MAGN|nr:hypothetical protein MKW98_001041 [Papaver atlanticum]